MTNWFMAIYNLDDKEKLNTPRKIAFRQTNLIKIIIGKFTDKTRKHFFYSFFFFFFWSVDLNLKSYIPWFVNFSKSSWCNLINCQWYKILHHYNFSLLLVLFVICFHALPGLREDLRSVVMLRSCNLFNW